MQESFNKWFFSKGRHQEQNDEEKEVAAKPAKKKRPQKYVNRRIMRVCK